MKRHFKDIQKIIQKYYRNLRSNILRKVKEIHEVLDTSESLKLNQEETSNLDP